EELGGDAGTVAGGGAPNTTGWAGVKHAGDAQGRHQSRKPCAKRRSHPSQEAGAQSTGEDQGSCQDLAGRIETASRRDGKAEFAKASARRQGNPAYARTAGCDAAVRRTVRTSSQPTGDHRAAAPGRAGIEVSALSAPAAIDQARRAELRTA